MSVFNLLQELFMGTGRLAKLVIDTQAHFKKAFDGPYEGDTPWRSIRWLHQHGSNLVFRHAMSWLTSDDPLKRERAASILGQLRASGWRHSHRPGGLRYEPARLYQRESFDAIVAALQKESDARAISSFISALGHLDIEESVSVIAAYAEHESADVRFSVSWALGCYPRERQSVQVLERLMEDTDRDVRDWAIFGVGVQGDADSSQLRDSFVRHLDDSFLDARIEAAAALAKRHDARVVRPLIRMLRQDGALRGLTEAARDMLKMSDDPPDWLESEYIDALENHFPKAT
jgi:hypothetical protein